MSAAPNERATLFSEHGQRYKQLGWALTRADGKKARGARWQTTTPEEPGAVAGMWAEWGKRCNAAAQIFDRAESDGHGITRGSSSSSWTRRASESTSRSPIR